MERSEGVLCQSSLRCAEKKTGYTLFYPSRGSVKKYFSKSLFY